MCHEVLQTDETDKLIPWLGVSVLVEELDNGRVDTLVNAMGKWQRPKNS